MSQNDRLVRYLSTGRTISVADCVSVTSLPLTTVGDDSVGDEPSVV